MTSRDEAVRIVKEIGLPLIEAASGGGGRGMRVVQKAEDLQNLIDEVPDGTTPWYYVN
jgi:biotin carboxylase